MATLGMPPKHGGKNYYRIWHTLFEIDKKYVPIEPIGRGAYGVVCSSLNVETNERVAIKKISNVFQNNTYALRTLRELILLRCIKEHGNVIALKDVLIPTDLRRFNDVYLVYELMNTDLHQIIYNSPTPLSNEECRYFLWQILRGLKYLHSANVLHRDLKPANLLVKKNSDLKICDFGLARSNREQGKSMTEYVVTRWYRAPELLLSCDNYGPSIDMWSAGCIFAEILGRKPLFQGTDSLNQLKLIISVLGGQPDSNLEFIDQPRVKTFVQSLNSYPETHFSSLFPQADPLALDLLSRMLVFDPSKRITATEALDHPYITTLYDPDCSPEAEFHVDVDHINESVGEPILRELMLKEILRHHPQAADASVLW